MIKKRVSKSGDASYQVYSGASGRHAYVGSYPTEKLAKDAEADHEYTQRAIKRGDLPTDHDNDRTLRDATDEWIKALDNRKSRSAAIYRKRLDLYIVGELGSTPIARIRKPHVIAFRDRLSTKYAAATVNGIMTCLSSAFAEFVDREWVEVNPCVGVAAIKNPDRIHNWIKTREEMTKLLAACAGDLRDMVAVALGTGMRLDELLHLQFADLDMGRRIVTVSRGRQGTTKSGRIRKVPILDSVLPVLRARVLNRNGATLVFPGKGGGVRAKQGVGPIYKLALKRAGLDTTLRWHDLRHTMAVTWVSDGGDIFRLSKILGHADVKLTARLYADYAPEAFDQDYHRVAFVVPTERANLYSLKRDEDGKIIGRVAVAAAG